MIILSHRIFLLDEVFVSYNLHFGVSGGFFQGTKLRTLVYAIRHNNFLSVEGNNLINECQVPLSYTKRNDGKSYFQK